MKKTIAVILSVIMLLSMSLVPAFAEDGKIQIVTTIFPIYDWIREVVGDNGNVEITMLLDSGVDLHNFQPTAQDIMKVATCDLFVYVGGESDEWAEDVLTTAMNPKLVAVNLVEALGEDIKAEEIVEGMEHEHEDHDHEDHDHEDHDHEDHDHEEHEEHDHDEHDHDHEEEADEHVWLSLRCAQKLTAVIAAALEGIDPDNAALYQENAAAYTAKLAELDARYAETVNAAAYKTILFGDRFPFRYMADDYGLTYYAAFSGCSAETEASFKTIAFLAQKVDELQLPAVMTIEGARHQIAETVIASTAAKNQKQLTMNSMQGITAQDVQQGISYLAVMEENLSVLKEALN